MSQEVTLEKMDQYVGTFVRDRMRGKPNEPVQTWVDLAIETNTKIYAQTKPTIVTSDGTMDLDTYNKRMPEVVKKIFEQCIAFWDAHPQQDYRIPKEDSDDTKSK